MLDIMIDDSGDIVVSAIGDISITNSVRQAVVVRLRWIFNEWRLGPEFGFKWFEQVFVKNPNTSKIKKLVREEIMKVDRVTAAEVISVTYDKASRKAVFVYTCTVGEEVFREEVALHA